jgi:transcriptional regulator with XRE-family HTH domain
MTLGEKVLFLRRRRGWSQKDLAAGAAVSLSTLQRVEQGHLADPKSSIVRRLACALNVSADYLLGMHGSAASDDQEQETTGDKATGRSPLGEEGDGSDE